MIGYENSCYKTSYLNTIKDILEKYDRKNGTNNLEIFKMNIYKICRRDNLFTLKYLLNTIDYTSIDYEF